MKKKALGRGLAELIPEIDKEIPLEKNKVSDLPIRFIPVENILFFPLQPRVSFKEDAAFEELIKSIKEKGVLEKKTIMDKIEMQTF